jgi:hypothetical protein
MKKTYVYDFETIGNCFLAIYINIKDTSDMEIFQISDFKNDLVEFVRFNQDLIRNKNYIVSFNGLSFDAQVAKLIIDNKYELLGLDKSVSARKIFSYAQQVIDHRNENGWNLFNVKDLLWNEIDLAAINNYNNKQKFASLKWLQFNMDWHNVMDMNCKPSDILTEEQIEELQVYCINDCLSTRELLTRNVEQIEVRDNLSEHFGLELQNLSEPKLVKAILSDLLSKDLNIPKKELKKKRTFRSKIHLDEVILPYIKFQTKPLQDTLIKFKNLALDAENLKGSFAHKVTYRGLELSFALGGIHGAKRGIYAEEDDMIIKSFDVKSYYPNLCIRNKWGPAHFDPAIYCNRYEWFYDERLKYPKSNPLNYLYKIVLNSAYGLSNDKHSFLKDSLLTMQTTVNGQLLLVQLMEELCESIPGARPIMINTDGGEIILPKEYVPVYEDICTKWEKMTNLILEFEDYQKLIIWDVNNYIGIFKPYEIEKEKAKSMYDSSYPKPLMRKRKEKYFHYPVKLKGRFEIDKQLHKNKSNRIKPIAIYNYFVHGKSPEETIKENKNIYDYCAGVRAKGGWKVVQTCIEDGDIFNEDSQKTIRYFISHKGCKLIKRKEEVLTENMYGKNKHGEDVLIKKAGDTLVKEIKVEASGVMEQVAIQIDPNKSFDEYRVNFQYYEKLIRKEIETVEPLATQTSLF